MSRNPTEPTWVREYLHDFNRSVRGLRTWTDLRNLAGEHRQEVRDLVWRARDLAADAHRLLGPVIETDADRASDAMHQRLWRTLRDVERLLPDGITVTIARDDLRALLLERYR